MIKKEVLVCDICNNTFARKKCFLCDKDICSNCGNRSKVVYDMFLCKPCNSRVKMMDDNFMEDFLETLGVDTKAKMKEYLVKRLIAEELSGERK